MNELLLTIGVKQVIICKEYNNEMYNEDRCVECSETCKKPEITATLTLNGNTEALKVHSTKEALISTVKTFARLSRLELIIVDNSEGVCVCQQM